MAISRTSRAFTLTKLMMACGNDLVPCLAADQWEAEAEREQGPMATLLREAAKLMRDASQSEGEDVSRYAHVQNAMRWRKDFMWLVRAWVAACDRSEHAEDREHVKPIADALALLDAGGDASK